MMATAPNARNDWRFDLGGYGDPDKPLPKKAIYDAFIRYKFAQTQRMFEWKGLPDTIRQRDLELLLQKKGKAFWVKIEEGTTQDGRPAKGIYALEGGFSGVLNQNYFPTKAVIANPYLQYQRSDLVIGEDTIVMGNDPLYMGLLPLASIKSRHIAETLVSLRLAVINARIPTVAYADNDATAKDFKDFFKKIEEGQEIGCVGGNPFFEGLRTAEWSHSQDGTIKQLTEYLQYTDASWYNALGIEANYNMKREAINSAESGMNVDSLLPLSDAMLESRKEAIEKINEKFGLEISVDFSSAWKKIRVELEAEQKLADKLIEEPKEETPGEETPGEEGDDDAPEEKEVKEDGGRDDSRED